MKRLICGLAARKRRKRGAPQHFAFGRRFKMRAAPGCHTSKKRMMEPRGANQVLSTPINTALQCGASPGPGNTAVLTAFRLDGDCGNKPLKRFGGLGITFHRAEARCEWDNRLVQNQICARNRESWRKKCKLQPANHALRRLNLVWPA